jgi:glucose/arabinose dehydrogenase
MMDEKPPHECLMDRPVSKFLKPIHLAVLCLAALGCLYWGMHGRGWKLRVLNTVWTFHPRVTDTRPHNGQTGVMPDDFVAADVMLPNIASGVDGATLAPGSVKLYRTRDHQAVEARLNTTGSGDAIVLQPMGPLELATSYTFEVTPQVKDTRNGSFRPYSMSFTTVSNVHYDSFPAAFQRLPLPTAVGRFTSLTIGPDHRLYVATFDQGILRFPINADGTLGPATTIDSIAQANHESRLIVGLRFDPKSTADNLILWTTHSPGTFSGAPDWSSKISKLTGPDLATYQDIVVGLPRAVKDHVTMLMDFGPDGAVYFSQGSNTGMGAPDSKWGFRDEHLLSAAILRLDPSLIKTLPLNAKTEGQGKYDPFAPNAPLTFFATGVRVGYAVLWHSNGHCYVGINGSAAHANVPGTPSSYAGLHRPDQDARGPYTGPPVQAIFDIRQTQPDFFYKIEKGGYYGHPNPFRAEYVLNGGNPTAGDDPVECPDYPVGTLPDRNWRQPTVNFGPNVSPDGMIEYHGKEFGGALDHKILITRYSGGKDIDLLTLNDNGDVIESDTGIDGLTRLADPLDLVQDSVTGFLYIDELGGRTISLVRPIPGGVSRRVLHQNITPPVQDLHFTSISASH